MADPTTRPPHATRAIETTLGLLTYAELAPLLAERVQRVQEAITRGDHDQGVPGCELLRAFHAAICADLVPAWAGRWRSVSVVVGSHEPPFPHQVPLRMHDYEADLGVRLEALSDHPELLPEALAASWEQRLATPLGEMESPSEGAGWPPWHRCGPR